MQDDAPPKKIAFRKVDRRRKQGRPRLRWLNTIEEIATRNISDWKVLDSDRMIWRTTINRF